MTAVVYVGPTLPLDIARTILDADFRPPIQQGDVHRALAETPRPTMIGIIDGAWDTVPTVWHKEIMYAMQCGVRVYGAGSLGALRAVELEAYGMVGIGEVFRAYRTGKLEDDDEVAVIHASAEDGYRSLSAAMVDIRATVKAAVNLGQIGANAADRIVRAAKARHYSERTWPPRLERLPLKSIDAQMMLQRMAQDLAAGAPWTAPRAFEPTDHWHAAWASDTGQEVSDDRRR